MDPVWVQMKMNANYEGEILPAFENNRAATAILEHSIIFISNISLLS
jgi:hypothetical protein